MIRLINPLIKKAPNNHGAKSLCVVPAWLPTGNIIATGPDTAKIHRIRPTLIWLAAVSRVTYIGVVSGCGGRSELKD